MARRETEECKEALDLLVCQASWDLLASPE